MNKMDQESGWLWLYVFSFSGKLVLRLCLDSGMFFPVKIFPQALLRIIKIS